MEQVCGAGEAVGVGRHAVASVAADARVGGVGAQVIRVCRQWPLDYARFAAHVVCRVGFRS